MSLNICQLFLTLHWNGICSGNLSHDDTIKWKLFPRYWPFVRGIHQSPVNSPHKGQWRGAVMFSLICVWMNGWVNNREAGDLRHHRARYDVTVMVWKSGAYISDIISARICWLPGATRSYTLSYIKNIRHYWKKWGFMWVCTPPPPPPPPYIYINICMYIT